MTRCPECESDLELDGYEIDVGETMNCPECSTEQWAMVTIADGRIARIEAVELTRATLEAANFISDTNAWFVAQRFAEMDPADRAGGVDVLRRHLP